MECVGCQSWADYVSYYLLLIAVAPANLYVLFYWFRPWTRTPQGRALMVKALGNAVLLDIIFSANWFHDYPGRGLIRVIGFAFFTAGGIYLLVALLRSQGAREYPPFTWSTQRRWAENDVPPLVTHEGRRGWWQRWRQS